MLVPARTQFVLGAPFIVLGLVTLVLFIVVLVDMVRRPAWQWQQAGSNKTMWILLEVLLFVLFGFLSIVSGIVYLVAARPKLVAAERAGQAGRYGSPWETGGYGGPPGGYGWPSPSGGYGAPPHPGEPSPGGYGTAPPAGEYGGAAPAGGSDETTSTEPPGAAPRPATESDRPAEQGPPAYPGTFTQAPAPGEWPTTQSQVPASWQPDPTRRHELRYWDGTRWTEHVADGGTQSTDPPA